MSSFSKQVNNRLKTAEHVQTSVEVNAASIARAVASRVPKLKTSEVRHVIEAITEHLAETSEGLRAAEHAYTEEQSDDAEPRQARDEAASALAARLGEIRTLIRATLGQRSVARYGLRGTLPSVAVDLAALARNSVVLLRKHPIKTSPMPGVTIDTGALAGDLEGLEASLRAALNQVKIEERELHKVLIERDAAIDEWTELYTGAAALLEGCYRIAGRADLAGRIRPTTRRAEGREAADQSDEGDTQAPLPDAPEDDASTTETD